SGNQCSKREPSDQAADVGCVIDTANQSIEQAISAENKQAAQVSANEPLRHGELAEVKRRDQRADHTEDCSRGAGAYSVRIPGETGNASGNATDHIDSPEGPRAKE